MKSWLPTSYPIFIHCHALHVATPQHQLVATNRTSRSMSQGRALRIRPFILGKLFTIQMATRLSFLLPPPLFPFRSSSSVLLALTPFPRQFLFSARPFANSPLKRFPRMSNNPPNQPPRPPASNTSEYNGLFASSPELEQLAMRSVSAPVLSRVVSYNLLSSSLADPSHFPACTPENLTASTRLNRIFAKLEGPVASRSIICLQEVSLDWSGALHAFFANRGFHLMLGAHGSYFNGYMGEGLAFPLDLYEPVDLRIERLTDKMSWPSKPKQEGVSKVASDISDRLQRAYQALFGPKKPKRFAPREPWDHARGRHNRFIFARLKSRTNGAKICVATYHMPCIYWSPPVMLIHAALVVRTFQKLCGNDQGVLAGDFNIKPQDESYAMILRGEVDTAHEHFPTATPDGSPPEKWFPMPLAPMKSAYREVLGSEPDFTNYAKVENNPTFIETLDYLFCTPNMDVVDVIRLPDRDAVQGPFPDASEPSDHVMIGATFRLPAPVRQERKSAAARAFKN